MESFRHGRKFVPCMNTSSTSDISFMLLIFFLVTTSMDIDKGLTRQLPPADPKEEEQLSVVEEGSVLKLDILSDNTLLCDGEPMAVGELQKRVEDFVSKTGKSHIIRLQANRNASYDTYFHVQNEIVSAYTSLRDKMAMRKYGHKYAVCTEQEREVIQKALPQRIAEAYVQEGGEQ